ncbi:NUDIX domain-containing protein [Ensifer sp. ENS12]|uniref:NUDIX hydrolase n=1 Tax=unclassified Ensifer TaxID=2633371 RepID=UPI000DD64BD0|nr:NUDIX domain-containing protein [Ensifer sp. ENS12]MBV7519911.1 NUDIX domain-containing protein [Ensifer sp. ENS12]
MSPDAHKVLIYATWQDQLLVFDEPDFPEIELQVPGGTMEPGESPETSALREFVEETGLTPSRGLTHLVTKDYSFRKEGQTICHRRHYFHVALAGEQQKTWLHHEMTPFGGGAPIRFRFFWLGLDEASRRLGYGMQDGLDYLHTHGSCPSP